MTQPTAAIFDLDGTLIDSAPDIAAAVNRFLTDTGWPAIETATVEKYIGHGPRKLLQDLFALIGHPADEATLTTAHKAYLENYNAAPADLTQFFPHVREDLKALADAGIALGICTNKPHDLTLRVLDALGLSGQFSSVVGAGVLSVNKPDPAHLLEVARRMGLEAGDWVYVGDTVVDQTTARSADVPFYAVPWGGGAEIDVPSGHRLTRLSDVLRIDL